jgi:hypothetical protein
MQASRSCLALALAVTVLGAVAAAPIIGAKPEEGSQNWLADDAEVVMVMNFKAALKSDLLSKGPIADLFKKGLNDEKAKEVLGTLGLDPMKDLDSVIMSASNTAEKEKANFRMVLRGSFDVEKMTAAMKKADNVTTSKEGKVELFEVKVPQGDQNLYGAFSGKNAFVLTMSKEATVDLAKNGATKAPRKNKVMESALKRFTGKECVAMAVVVTDEMKKQAGANPALAGAVKALNSLTFSVTLSADVDIALVGNTEDGAAKKLATQLTGLKALGDAAISMMDNIPEAAKKLFEEIKIDNTRDTVTISLKVDKATLEKAAKMADGGN